MHRTYSTTRPFSAFKKPHEILSAANITMSLSASNPFSHSRSRNRSSGGSESSASSQPTPNLLLDDDDDYSRTRAKAPVEESWSGDNAIPLLPMAGATGQGVPGGMNLLSRTPSPYPPKADEPEIEADLGGDWRIGEGGVREDRGLREWGRDGRLGRWLWGTQRGWIVYMGMVVTLYGVCSFGLLVMNRFILWTGVYKFGYPIVTTLLELIITQILLYLTASITRSFSRSLHSLGLGCIVVPDPLPCKGKRRESSGGLRDFARQLRGADTVGGVFEFRWAEAKVMLPLATVYALKVGLSNLAFAYTQLSIYHLSRVHTLLLTLVFTYFFHRQQPLSVTTLSSSITMVVSLLVVSLRPHTRFAIEGFLAGIFSALFVAAYPIMLVKTYKSFMPLQSSSSDPDLLGDSFYEPVGAGGTGDDKEEARKAWKMLHYINVLSILLILPWAWISGEAGDVQRNCYFLDVPFFWFMIVAGGIAAWGSFVLGLAVVKATSPLTMIVTSYPKAAMQSVFLMHFKLPVWSWVGVLMCWGSAVWYALGRRKECGVSFFNVEEGENGWRGRRRERDTQV
ncbi:hypothetical protein RUND412_010700 [Rhizina undulata]